MREGGGEMNKSETISKLAMALAKAQAKIKGAVKDSENPFFKSKYADLESVWGAIREPFTSNGLSVTQLTNSETTDGVVIETVLMHESGEWISSHLLMKPVKNDPQGVGSAITYGRRYGLQAIAGVCPEDDDGNKASGQGTILEATLTEAQAEAIRKLITESGANLEGFLAYVGVKAIGEIPAKKYGQVITQLEAKKARGK